MKKSLVLLLLLTNILGYEPTTTPTLITFKLESSEILTDFEGSTPKSQNQVFELRQIDENTFEVLGSPLSRAIENQMRQ